MAIPHSQSHTSSNPAAEVRHAILAWLGAAHTTELIITINGVENTRIRVTENDLQWVEKTADSVSRYQLRFDTEEILHNGATADPLIIRSFEAKLSQLISAVSAESYSLYTKDI